MQANLCCIVVKITCNNVLIHFSPFLNPFIYTDRVQAFLCTVTFHVEKWKIFEGLARGEPTKR